MQSSSARPSSSASPRMHSLSLVFFLKLSVVSSAAAVCCTGWMAQSSKSSENALASSRWTVMLVLNSPESANLRPVCSSVKVSD